MNILHATTDPTLLARLTEEEDTAIERSLGLIHATDEEENAALVRATGAGSGH